MTADAQKSLRFGVASAVGLSPSHASPLFLDSVTNHGAPGRSLTTATVQNSPKCDALPGGGPSPRGAGPRPRPRLRGRLRHATDLGLRGRAGSQARPVRSPREPSSSVHVSECSPILCSPASPRDEAGGAAGRLRVPGQDPELGAGPPRGAAGRRTASPAGQREQQRGAVPEQILVTTWPLTEVPPWTGSLTSLSLGCLRMLRRHRVAGGSK